MQSNTTGELIVFEETKSLSVVTKELTSETLTEALTPIKRNKEPLLLESRDQDRVKQLEEENEALRQQVAALQATAPDSPQANGTTVLDSLRIKLNRLEFANKEAVHFLLKLAQQVEDREKQMKQQAPPGTTVPAFVLFESKVLTYIRFAIHYLTTAHVALTESVKAPPIRTSSSNLTKRHSRSMDDLRLNLEENDAVPVDLKLVDIDLSPTVYVHEGDWQRRASSAATPPPGLHTPVTATHEHKCPECATVFQQLNELRQENQRIQLAKDILDSEVEELTQTLFEQANTMLADETRARAQITESHNALQNRWQTLVRVDALRTKELDALRAKLNLDRATSIITDPEDTIWTLPEKLLDSVTTFVDGLALGEFQSYVQFLSTLKTDATNVMPQLRLMDNDHVSLVTVSPALFGSPYIKRIVAEDVEPCLAMMTPWKTLNRKRFYESLHRGFLSAEKIEGPVTKQRCACCNTIRECHYKLRLDAVPENKATVGKTSATSASVSRPASAAAVKRDLSPSTEESSYPIDVFCKDRLQSVVEFYQFVGRLQHQRQLPLLEQFKLLLYHRRRMQTTRIGSTSMFESELMQQVRIVQ